MAGSIGGHDIPIDEGYARNQDDARTITSTRTTATVTTIFRHENGRTYHSFRDGEYWQPNDAKQINHETIVHHLCIMTLRDRLYLAPLEQPKKILDLGTGTGLWASDMADKFPEAQVIGMDLSPIQPTSHPNNCVFEVDDCTSPWVYEDNSFDFVHVRGLFGSIADWPALYQQIFKHLAPGGYVEQLEWSLQKKSPDGTLTSDRALYRWPQIFYDISEKTGKSFKVAETMADSIREAGFVDVVEKVFNWPIGPWSSDPHLKEIGRWNMLNWEHGMEGWALAAYTRVLGWSYKQVQEWLADIKKDIKDRRMHVYHEVRLVYGRKPPQPP